MNTNFEYIFPAIRGIQAEREYFVSMCPLRLIPRIFLFDEEELKPELRAQRTLNKGRIPQIARYVLENRNSYVFSAITASVDGKVRFQPMGTNGEASRLGALHVDMSAKFIINDGQHRRAAIEQALSSAPELGDETISVVFFIDRGLVRSQQMFADLNQYSVRPSRSLSVLYDHRTDLAQIAKLVTLKTSAFKDLVDAESNSLSERSRKLFTLSAIKNACAALLEDEEYTDVNHAAETCIQFWEEVARYIPEWPLARASKITSCDIRRDFLHSHAIALQAFGIVGRELTQLHKGNWREKLAPIGRIDWSRSNAHLWEGRALIGGRVSKASHNVTLTTNLIKKHLGLPLGPEEERAEQAFIRGKTQS